MEMETEGKAFHFSRPEQVRSFSDADVLDVDLPVEEESVEEL